MNHIAFINQKNSDFFLKKEDFLSLYFTRLKRHHNSIPEPELHVENQVYFLPTQQ